MLWECTTAHSVNVNCIATLTFWGTVPPGRRGQRDVTTHRSLLSLTSRRAPLHALVGERSTDCPSQRTKVNGWYKFRPKSETRDTHYSDASIEKCFALFTNTIFILQCRVIKVWCKLKCIVVWLYVLLFLQLLFLFYNDCRVMIKVWCKLKCIVVWLFLDYSFLKYLQWWTLFCQRKHEMNSSTKMCFHFENEIYRLIRLSGCVIAWKCELMSKFL